MGKYYFELIRNADIVLITLNFGLAAVILIYAAIDKWSEGIRYRHLRHIISGLQTLAFKDDNSLINGCTLIMRKSTPFEFSDILKRQSKIPSGKFSSQLMECINDSGKIPGIERTAKKSMLKWRRIEAIVMLGYLNSANALGILEQSLSSKDSDISYFSLISLGHIKNAESAKILLAAVKNRTFAGSKIASILEHFPPVIVEILIKGAEGQDESLRVWSIKLISRFKPKQYANKISVFTDDASPDIRASACECLGEIGEESTKEAVKKCLKDNIWYVRMHATRALESILGPGSISDIAPLLKDDHWFVRENVKDIMVKHFSQARPFIEKFLGETDEDVKRDCVEIMDNAMKYHKAGA